MNSKVSIIIPVYNNEKYIENCILSALDQTYENIEIIVVNDGSTDNTQSIVNKYAKLDKRIKIHIKKNEGLSSARNLGILKSKGKFVFFLDSDDCIQENTIEKLMEMQQEREDRISMCLFESFEKKYKYSKYDAKNTLKLSDKEFFLEVFKLNYSFYACGVLFPKSILNNNVFPIGMFFEDLASMYKIFSLVSSIYITNAKFYKYRKNCNSIVHKINEKKVIDYIKASKEMIEFSKNKYNFTIESINVYKCEFLIECYIFTKDIKYVKQYKDIYKNAKINNCNIKNKIKMYLFYTSNIFRKYLIYKNNIIYQ